MVYDSLSPFAPARIRCLLVPHGRITKARFFEFVARLQLEAVVRLGDVSPSKDSDDTAFAPESFPEGRVIYDFSTSRILTSNTSLVPFELYREDFVILAVGDGRTPGGTGGDKADQDGAAVVEYTACVASLKEEYSTALVHRLLLFDRAKSDTRLPQDVMPLAPPGNGSLTVLKTAVAEITSALLQELATLARSIQALPSIETPRAQNASGASHELSRHQSLRLDQTNGRQSPASDAARNPNRASMPAHLSYMSSDTSVGTRPLSTIGATTVQPDSDAGSSSDRPSSSTEVGSRGHSRDRVSVSGFGSGSIGERVRNQAQSHIHIVVGSIFLLAGKWRDAVTELIKGVATAKANSDYIWHAKGIDLLLVALLLTAWAGMDFDVPPIIFPFGDKSSNGKSQKKSNSVSGKSSSETVSAPQPHEVALQSVHGMLRDLAFNLLHLYSRAAEFNSIRVPQVLFSETTVRLTKLLLITESCESSLDRNALSLLVLPRELQSKPQVRRQPLSAWSKNDIVTILYRAIPLASSEEALSVTEKLHILAGVASVLSALGFHRKKALVLREVVTQLLPALIQNRKDSAAEQGLHPAASLSTLDLSVAARSEGGEHSQAPLDNIQSMLALVCEVYGVASPSVSRPASADKEPAYDSADAIALRAFESAKRRGFGNITLKADVLRTCINVCEALPDLDGVLRFSSDLLCTAGSGIAPGPGTMDALPSIPAEDQARLTASIGRAINAANQLGLDGLAAGYWDEFLVRDITLSLEEARYALPVMRKKQELQLSSGTKDGAQQGPFIFDPFASKLNATAKEIVLVRNEEARFTLLLQNLYEVDLEIEWIKFDCTDVEVDSITRSVVIGPYRTQKVHFACIPRSSGRLVVNGCIAKVRGCQPRRFPLFKAPWRLNQDRKVKRIGLAASELAHLSWGRSDSKGSDVHASLLPKMSSFEATVIGAQPTLSMKSMSVAQSALMILDGEKQRFTVVLKNAGDIPIDLALISLSDNTAEYLKAATSNKEVAPSAVYEEEVSAYRFPALSLAASQGAQDLAIPPRGERTLELEAYGKLGLRTATVTVDYGHLGVPRSEAPDSVYTRQFAVDVDVTVVSSVGLVNNDVLPITEDLPKALERLRLTADRLQMPPALQHLLQENCLPSCVDYCLLLMDFHNAWSEPISLDIRPPRHEGSQGGRAEEAAAPVVIQPNSTARFLVPCPKLRLANPWAQVPSLNPKHKRQYVVTTGAKADPEAERSAREVFWHREALLDSLAATWTVQGGRGRPRTGRIDLRRLVLTPRMLDTLRQADVEITLQVVRGDGAGAAPSPPTSFVAPAAEFVTLVIRLRSRLGHAIQPLLRVLPAMAHQAAGPALDLGRRVAFNGALQRRLPALAAGGEAEVRVGMAFLARGEYEIGAVVEELRLPEPQTGKEGGRPRAATGDFSYDALTERTARKAWYAREPCAVRVVDGGC